VDSILRCIRRVLENIPGELSGDLLENGLTLTGGASLLPGLDHRIATACGVPVRTAEAPALSVALGLAKLIAGVPDRPWWGLAAASWHRATE
jgi:rod shape-determining protein MreB